MAESVVSFAAEHIKKLMESDLSDVHNEAKAVQEELANIAKFLCDNKEQANKNKFLLWLPTLRKLAYDAEDAVDTYISDAKSFSNLSRGLLRNYRARQASKQLSRLCKEMKEVLAEMEKQRKNGFDGDSEKEKQRQTDKEKQDQIADSPEKELGDSLRGLEEIEGSNNADASTDSDEDVMGSEEEGEEEYTTDTKAAGSQQSNKGHRQADDEIVVGIEEDVERLVKMLTAPKGKAPLDALAIVGMGGAGKTTLARNIYNDPRVKKHFKYQVWVPLPQRWTTSEVVSTISNEIHMNKLRFECQHHNHESDHDHRLVPSCLRMKKCLVVLDDVWDWESLQNLIPMLIKREHENHQQTFWDFCKNDYDITKIVITSRYQYPLEPPNTCFFKIDEIQWYLHEVQLLNKDYGWDLFNKVSSSDDGKELAREYSGLATEMLSKCGGLPLAIVALGKLLKTKDSIQGWERVFSLLVSKEGPNDLYLPVNDILALSYHDLDYHLKPCFIYFGLFPEDFLIKAGTLIRMWLAEGFVQKQYKDNNGVNKSEGEAAIGLLQQLINHTMVQVVGRNYTGKVKTLRVHDIMRDLCIKQAREIDFLTVCYYESDQIAKINSRRAAMNLSKCPILPLENSHLRSLFLHDYEGVGKRGSKGKQKAITLDLALVCEKFKLLRVLDINGIKTSDGMMPKEIGNLFHLRYLRIRSTNIRELPRTIGKLRNLLTLDYWDVSVDNCGIRLPNVLCKLKKLRHLYLPNEVTNNTKESLKLHMIKDLQTLWGVRGGDWMTKEMEKLSTNINKLYIQGISKAEQMKSVLDCNLIKKKDSNLYSLALNWYGFSFEGLEALNSTNNSNLIKVRLMGKAPDTSKPLKFPSTLNKLELYHTQLQQSESMKALGELTHLKFLRLAKDSFIGKEWKVLTEDSFPELENLKLFDLLKLEEWEVSKESMKKLKKLTISGCTSLKRMPEGLKPFDKFERLKTKNMPAKFIDDLQPNDNTKANSIARELYSTILNIFSIATRTSPVLTSIIYAICIILCIFVVWWTWFKAR
ncbi:probable disease resistance RPP8-like protein 2 [Chenopodium quinoa]|uniref:probable disease resistance RPP8-like protein 2 n=1 Tax=Chenopodium quinoa TaxID=63459 RepID=UPI000B78712C|nr:probable disease resistance RPP8-like protein 2 [Chenopodium quinoa]